MAKEKVLNVSDTESTGSNGDNPVTATSTDGQCSNQTPKKINKQTSNKNPQQGPTSPPVSLSPNPNTTFARVVPSPPPPKANYKTTAATVVRSPPPPPPPNATKTTNVVPIAPQPPALWINLNAGGSGAGQHQRFHPYVRPMDPPQPRRTVDLMSRMEAVGLAPPCLWQINQQPPPPPRTTVDFLSQVNQQPWRTVDFLSQMEAGTSVAPAQVPRVNPPIETLVEWASSLRLGDGRKRNVDLNLKLKLV